MKITRYFFMFLVMALTVLMGSFASLDSSTNSNLIATATPTKTPIKYFLEFKKENLNKVPPKDILEQVGFFMGGGGVICAGPQPAQPKIAAKPQDGLLMTQSTMIACGWKKGEVLKGTVVYPNGSVVTKSINVEFEFDPGVNQYFGALSFTAGPGDPTGNYTFILEGKSGTVKDTVNFKKPVGPHLFIVDPKTIIFYGFTPQEKVRFFYYAPDTRKLIGWQEYTMDGMGQLILKSAVPFDGYFWAVGKSGEAQLPGENPLFGGTIYPSSQTTIKKISCGDLPSRFGSLHFGSIAFTKVGGNTRLHSEPGLSQPVTAKVPEGTTFSVVDGPKCADGLTWWKISTSNPNATGWVAESYNNVYLIEP